MADEEWVDIGAAARFAARPLAQIALSRACLAISQRGGQFGAISGVRACLTVLLLLLVTRIAPAGAAENAPPGTSIPAIASIAKMQIGYSTQQDIDAQWGEGKTIIGGHPNSGRLWRVKETPWVLHTELRKGTLTGHAGTWQAEFVDTASGRVIKTRTVKATKSLLKIALPDFQGSIALKLTAPIPKPPEK